MPPVSLAQGKRRKLWEIDPTFHCSLLGTCLSPDDLRSLCRRAQVQLQKTPSDFDLHHAFVELAERPCYATRLLQRRLDQRHRAALRDCNNRIAQQGSETDVLLQIWQSACERGETAGVYWALMTHPAVDSAFCNHMAADVHMLSHLSGASRRRELRDIARLQSRLLANTQRLHEAQQAQHQQRKLIQALQQRVSTAQANEHRLEQLRARLTELEQGEALRCARAQSEDLAAELAQTRLATERHATQIRQLTLRCQRAEQQQRQLLAELATTRAERNSLEQLIQTFTRDCDSSCPKFDLCRRRILYVGGRPNLSPHLRQLVEQSNGEFLQHDGGREAASSALAAMLPSVDAVLCPIDCISHAAMLHIKRVCKRQAKPFLTLRSASLSAFAQGLQHLIEQPILMSANKTSC